MPGCFFFCSLAVLLNHDLDLGLERLQEPRVERLPEKLKQRRWGCWRMTSTLLGQCEVNKLNLLLGTLSLTKLGHLAFFEFVSEANPRKALVSPRSNHTSVQNSPVF